MTPAKAALQDGCGFLLLARHRVTIPIEGHPRAAVPQALRDRYRGEPGRDRVARHRVPKIVGPQAGDLRPLADFREVPSADVIAVQERSVRRGEDEGRPVPLSIGSDPPAA